MQCDQGGKYNIYKYAHPVPTEGAPRAATDCYVNNHKILYHKYMTHIMVKSNRHIPDIVRLNYVCRRNKYVLSCGGRSWDIVLQEVIGNR